MMTRMKNLSHSEEGTHGRGMVKEGSEEGEYE
jgi:hypothetical protein